MYLPYARHYNPRLVFFTPFFTAVYNQERLILQTTYVLKRGNSSKNDAVYNQEWVIMARVRYMLLCSRLGCFVITKLILFRWFFIHSKSKHSAVI